MGYVRQIWGYVGLGRGMQRHILGCRTVQGCRGLHSLGFRISDKSGFRVQDLDSDYPASLLNQTSRGLAFSVLPGSRAHSTWFRLTRAEDS